MLELIQILPVGAYVYTGIVIALSVISAGTAVYSSQQAAEAQEDAAAANARAAQERAEQEQKVAAENARRREKEAQKLIARQRAALAASGLAMTGTPLEVLGDTYTEEQMDIGDISYGAAARGRALRQQAFLELKNGQRQADETRIEGYSSALSSLSNGASYL